MSDYWERPVYDDIEDEARSDWLAERPPRLRAEDVLDGPELDAYYAHERPARAFRRTPLAPDPWEGLA